MIPAHVVYAVLVGLIVGGAGWVTWVWCADPTDYARPPLVDWSADRRFGWLHPETGRDIPAGVDVFPPADPGRPESTDGVTGSAHARPTVRR